MKPRERRRAPRHVPARDGARVGWWEGSEFRQVPARLRDLSGSGAAVAVEGMPREVDVVWVCLAGAGAAEWARASVARSVPDPEESARVLGLRFDMVCPLNLFRAAIWGTRATTDNVSVEAVFPPPPIEPTAPAPSSPPSTTTPQQAASRSASGRARRVEERGAADEWTFVALAGVDDPTLARPSASPEAAKSRRESEPQTTPLTWIVPAIMQVLLALMLAVVAVATFTDISIREPLLQCLTKE